MTLNAQTPIKETINDSLSNLNNNKNVNELNKRLNYSEIVKKVSTAQAPSLNIDSNKMSNIPAETYNLLILNSSKNCGTKNEFMTFFHSKNKKIKINKYK